MKKFISTFLALVLFISNSFGSINVFAEGVDKEETLADGTKLIYISTKNLQKKEEQCHQKLLEIKNQRFSTVKNLAIKGTALTAAAIGWYLSSNLEQNNPGLSISGKIASCVLGIATFLFPDYNNWECKSEDCEWICNTLNYWNFWLWADKQDPETLNDFYRNHESKYGEKCYYEWHGLSTCDKRKLEDIKNSGIVVVLRPESKKKIMNTFHNYIFSQNEFDLAIKPNVPSEHQTLLRVIEREMLS